MRNLSIAATLLIALTGCGTAPGLMTAAQKAAPTTAAATPQERAKQRFDKIDADKNGAISIDEFQAGKGGPGHRSPGDGKGPQSLDTDKDGKISFDEFKAHKPQGANAPADDKIKEFFDKLDTNKDGFLTADEQKPQGGPGFGRPGFGGPGFGRPGFGGPGFGHPGFGGPRGGHGAMGFGFGADADKDGKVTLDELKAAKGPGGQSIPADKAQAIFDKLDTNKDGAISQDDRPARGAKPAAK
jgi:Ca2+-binding EF-hand superfamily protein